MKSADNIKNLFKNSNITVGHHVDKKILNKATGALPRQAIQSDRNIWSIIMHSKITKPLAAAIIIIGILTGIYQLTGSLDGASVAWADVVEKCQNVKTLTFSSKVSGCITIHDGKDYDFKQTNYVMTPNIYKTTQIAGCLKRGDHLILDESLIDSQNHVLFIDHIAKHYYRYTLSNQQKKYNVDLIHIFKTLPDKADKFLGSKIVNRQKSAGFFLKGHGIDIKIWVNKRTCNPVLVEFFDDDSSHPSIVFSDFTFNPDIASIKTDIQIPSDYNEIDTPETLFMEDRVSSVNDLIYFLKLYAMYSEDGHFPDTISIKRDKEGLAMSVGLSSIEVSKVTESERQELQIKGPRTYDFLSRMKPENDWHYAGKGITPRQPNTPICWWRADEADKYTVIFADLTIKTLGKEELPKQ